MTPTRLLIGGSEVRVLTAHIVAQHGLSRIDMGSRARVPRGYAPQGPNHGPRSIPGRDCPRNRALAEAGAADRGDDGHDCAEASPESGRNRASDTGLGISPRSRLHAGSRDAHADVTPLVLVQREDDSGGCDATENPSVPHRRGDRTGGLGRVKGGARCAHRLTPPLTRPAPSGAQAARAMGNGMGSRDPNGRHAAAGSCRRCRRCSRAASSLRSRSAQIAGACPAMKVSGAM